MKRGSEGGPVRGGLDRERHPTGTGPRSITRSPQVHPPENKGRAASWSPCSSQSAPRPHPSRARAGLHGSTALGAGSPCVPLMGHVLIEHTAGGPGGQGADSSPPGPGAHSHCPLGGPSAQQRPGRVCSGWGQGRGQLLCPSPGCSRAPTPRAPSFLCQAEEGCPGPLRDADSCEPPPGTH